MTYLKFGTPQDVTNSGYDGMKINFPFQIIEPGQGARRDKVTEHSIIVDIVGTMLTTWGLRRSGSDLQSVAPYLFEYARKAAVEKLVEGSLAQCHEISVHGTNESYQNPFDPNKVTDPAGFVYEIDLAEARKIHRLQQKEKRGLGFKLNE
jgi:hypothetical protein